MAFRVPPRGTRGASARLRTARMKWSTSVTVVTFAPPFIREDDVDTKVFGTRGCQGELQCAASGAEPQELGVGGSGGLCDGFESDGVAKVVGLSGDAPQRVLRVTSLVIAGAEFPVRLVGGEHVPDREQDAVLKCNDRSQATDSGFEAVMTVLQERLVYLHAGHGGAAQRAFEIGIPGSGFRLFGDFGGLVVAGADTGPGREVPCGGELRHVSTGLGDDDDRDVGADPWDGFQQG